MVDTKTVAHRPQVQPGGGVHRELLGVVAPQSVDELLGDRVGGLWAGPARRLRPGWRLGGGGRPARRRGA
jgi:hypothetical protein